VNTPEAPGADHDHRKPVNAWRGAPDVTVRLAEALSRAGLGCEEFDPNDRDSGCPDCEDAFRYAAALLPVVDGIAAERAAEELKRAIVEDNISTHRLTPVEVLTLRVVKVFDLHARAAALRADEAKADS
jgi:hypothetical protein